MKNKAILTANVAIILAVFVINWFYQNRNFDFTLKCIASSLFAILGVINLIYAYKFVDEGKNYYVLMSLALAMAFLGDVLIGYDFITGAAVFAVGHIIFVAAYCILCKPTGLDIILSTVIFSASLAFLLLYPEFDFVSSAIKIVCIIYALIISLMLGKAIGNFVNEKKSVTSVIAVASFLFFFSDLMLVLGRFAGAGTWADNACMGTYYPALCLLAFSMFLKINTERNH